jgi:SAM-dependent methyltransferase
LTGDELHHGGYNPAYFEALAKAESEHFWFRARRSAIAAVLEREVAEWPTGYAVLEAGCGTGAALSTLRTVCRRGSVCGMDMHVEGLRYAAKSGAGSVVQADLAQPPFGRVFRLIGLFDVLEHIDDDAAALRALRGLLVENGIVVLTVPADPALWSRWDEAAGHARRYTMTTLRSALEREGFEVEYLGPILAALYPALWVTRRGKSGKAARKSEEAMVTEQLRVWPVLNAILYGLLRLEAPRISRRLRLPFGTSLIAVARRTDISRRVSANPVEGS